ncbi:hypothetical protein CNY67_03815 [Desulfovibrio sp. G11]|nr:hypothetical protein CNY67_03815 [Desulfovibrio sp. G11]
MPVQIRAEHRALPKKGQTVARHWQKGRVRQMQNFGDRIPVAHAQQHNLAFIARLLACIRAPDRKTHAFTRLGLTPEADAQAPQGQALKHQPPFLQDTGKGHDAAFSGAGSVSSGGFGRGSRLACHICCQPGASHKQTRLFIHAKAHFSTLHVLRVQGMPGAQTRMHDLPGQRRSRTLGLHTRKYRTGQFVARAPPTG